MRAFRVATIGGLLVLATAGASCMVPLGSGEGGSGGVIERGRTLCFDRIDNDGDGLTDCDDPYCKIVCEEICNDYFDNDGDGLNGCEDPKCAGQQCFDPHEVCGNTLDEDQNGLTECEDPACAMTRKCLASVPEICDNALDDNANLLADCKDPQCHEDPACPYEHCDNGVDDEGDGFADCDDPECREECGLVELCTGGVDEDQDGKIDCADSNCIEDAACIVGCRVRRKGAATSSTATHEDTCRAGYICTCAGAPTCPPHGQNPLEELGDFIGVTDECGLPTTCEDGGGCRSVSGRYTLRFRRAGVSGDDVFNESELYVVVDGERITEVQDDSEFTCDDCYRVMDITVGAGLTVQLWDEDILSLPEVPDVDHSDLLVECGITLSEQLLKERVFSCQQAGGFMEFTIEPHPQ